MRFNLMLAAIVLATASCSYMYGVGDANKFANEFIRDQLAGAADASHNCQSRDTDGNGYVSCTITVQWDPQDTRREVIPIECSVNRAFSGCSNKGCRPLTAFGRPSRSAR